MNHNLKQLNALKSITLTETERGRIRAHAVHTMSTMIPRRTSLFQQGMYHGLRIALSSFLFVVFVGGTVSAVADNALPGDPLYAFKLNINEEVKGLFQKTPEQKVAYGASRVQTRVNEIKTLAASKTLTKAKQATVQKALDSHIKDLSVDLGDVTPSAALTATTKLEDTLQANKLDIENTTDNDTQTKEAALMTVNGTIQKVANQEVKIISKEIDAIASDLDATPAATIDTSLSTPTPDSHNAVPSTSDTTDTPVGP